MKKVFLLFVLVTSIFIGAVNAQNGGKKTAAKNAKVEKQDPKIKKDGTPDMRYKDNKETTKAKPAGPVKKDGTPDMRYKENQKKEAAPKKKK